MKQGILVLCLLLLTACGVQQEESQSGQVSVPESGAVPTVDVSQHNVPLERIVFDTFSGPNRQLPFPESSAEQRESLIDRIPPLHDPDYESASDAGWLQSDDMILGYEADGQAWAFPIKILNFHEIVNDEFAGEPLLVSYCPLCASGIVYSRRIEERTLTFGNTSALYESDMVMLDYETGSYWWQVAGEAIVGPLTSTRLEPRASQMMTWADWQSHYPETRVLSRSTGFNRNYQQDPFFNYPQIINAGGFPFPVSEQAKDTRLEAATEVVVVETEQGSVAVPLKGSEPGVRNLPAKVVFYQPEGTAAVFQREHEGQLLTFEVDEQGRYRDAETGSHWSLSGSAESGPLQGEQLERAVSKRMYWFSAAAADPQIQIRQLTNR